MVTLVPATGPMSDAVTTYFAAVPGVSVIDAVFVNGVPSSSGVIVTDPAAVPAVYVAVYVPSTLSVTVPIEPTLALANVTVPPLDANVFPFASFSVTVSTLVELPSAVRLEGLATTTLVEADAVPGVSVIDVVFEKGVPSSSGVIVTEPVDVPAVYVAVYEPSALSVTVPIEPTLALANVTVPPFAVNPFPFASLSVTVNSLVELPSAVKLEGLATTTLVEADAAPGTVEIVPLVPVRLPPSVAVIVPEPTEFGVVNDTVAMPTESVTDVGAANDPPTNVVDHITVCPAVGTALSPESANWAVAVTAPPAVGLVLDTVTRYFAAGPCGVTLTDAELVPPPIPFTARNWIEYDVPFTRPDTVTGEVVTYG